MPAGLDAAPAWSPDGARIAGGSGYASRCPPHGEPCTRYDKLFVANADGSGFTIVARGLRPTWSPDGRIAFESRDIYVMNPDGSGVTNLTNGEGGSLPAWSPDGTRLAFVRYSAGAVHLYVMNADGSGVTQLTHENYHDLGRPAWSPDGTRIAFASDKDGDYEI